VVPFFARYFAGFATDADRRIGEETNLNIVAHVRMPTLIRAVCTFTDHENKIRKAGKYGTRDRGYSRNKNAPTLFLF
jgi:hypothetical protein